MEANKKKGLLVGVAIFAVIVVIGIAASLLLSNKDADPNRELAKLEKNAIVVTGAVGGGKENFLADEDVRRILLEKYKINVDVQHWSNGKLVTEPLEYGDGKTYDFAFFSDERFYEYYKQPAAEGEAPRLPSKGGAVTLSTPIVLYSWKEVADKFIEQGIVTKRGEVYYVTDMPKLLEMIKDDATWASIGLADTYGSINVASTDPVTSSPGATYYGLLASIMRGGQVDINNVEGVMPQLSEFYKYSGFLNNTPADLFDLYLRMGRGAYPLIVDYEKSILDFATNNPNGFNQVKDKIAVLYSEPTIWNSHCITAFSDNGVIFMEAMKDPEIQKIAWERYGFRTGVVGGDYNVEDIAVQGVPQEILSVVPSLKKEVYDIMIDSLKNGTHLPTGESYLETVDPEVDPAVDPVETPTT